MSHVVFDPDARSELLCAVAFYEEREKGLGRRFRRAVDDAIGSICDMPLSYRVLRPPFRRCLIRGFPYSLIYSIEPAHILIIAVAHGKRSPGYWQERVERNV